MFMVTFMYVLMKKVWCNIFNIMTLQFYRASKFQMLGSCYTFNNNMVPKNHNQSGMELRLSNK